MKESESFELHVAGLKGHAEKLEAELKERAVRVSNAEYTASEERRAETRVKDELTKVKQMIAIAEGKAK